MSVTDCRHRKQPWSTYAVYQTTILQWAFIWDCLLICLYYSSTETWSGETRMTGLGLLLSWMVMSKFLKLLGHYIRYPVDFLLLPISILFGYLHGLIKAKAMLSLTVVSCLILIRPSGCRRHGAPSIPLTIHFSVDCMGHPRRRGRR